MLVGRSTHTGTCRTTPDPDLPEAGLAFRSAMSGFYKFASQPGKMRRVAPDRIAVNQYVYVACRGRSDREQTAVLAGDVRLAGRTGGGVTGAAPPPGIPDGWSDGYAYVNGVRVHYYHAVPAPGKPVLVMVHGVTDIGLCWTTLTWRLQDQYDCYMLDTRGHGLSDPFMPSDDGDTLIKDVVEFVKSMKFEKPILMGHSMGAATVMRIGAEYPDLATAIIMLDPGLPRPGGGGPRAGAPGGRRGGPTTAPARSGPGTPTTTAPARSINMFGDPQTLVAQNNYSFDDLVATCHRQSPKWDMVDCQYWALSKKQYHGATRAPVSRRCPGACGRATRSRRSRPPALILKADAPPEGKANEEAARVMQHGKLVHVNGAAHNLHHDQLQRTVEVLKEFLGTL